VPRDDLFGPTPPAESLRPPRLFVILFAVVASRLLPIATIMRLPLVGFACLLAAAGGLPAAEKIAPKVIILAGFEVGDDTGDAPGEFQLWVEREHLTGTRAVKGAPHALRCNADGLYASVSSNTRDRTLTTVPASELVMALCLDPDLDLTHTYWIITGISGIDPAHGSIGSAVWAGNVVDADALREIDDSEVPSNWPYGLFAIGTMKPNSLPSTAADAGGWGGATLTYTMNTALNPALTKWAFDLSRAKVSLADSPALEAERAKYTNYAPARQPPQIRLGAAFSTARYWHGAKRTQWARDWVKLWTRDQDVLSTAAMEPAAYVGTLHRMAEKGLIDFNRVLMIRGASNYTMPPPGQDILSTMGDESMGTTAAFESLHATGSVVIHELLGNWTKYEKTRPDEVP